MLFTLQHVTVKFARRNNILFVVVLHLVLQRSLNTRSAAEMPVAAVSDMAQRQ